jgi:hypothetical protein
MQQIFRRTDTKVFLAKTINVKGCVVGNFRELDLLPFNSQSLFFLESEELYAGFIEMPDVVVFPECGLPVMLMLKRNGDL